MIGVVLAGGASSRFGGQAKGLMKLGTKPMAVRVADILTQFCAPVVIEAVPGAGYETLGYELVHADPEHAGRGPLAGIAAGLSLAGDDAKRWHSDPRVAFAPCDMPHLNRAVYRRLIDLDAPGAYAVTAAGAEPLVAVLSGDMRPTVLNALGQTKIARTQAVLDQAGAKPVAFDEEGPFTNVNTPDALARLEASLPPEPSAAFFALIGRVGRVVDALQSAESGVRERQLLAGLLRLLESQLSKELRDVFADASAHQGAWKRLEIHEPVLRGLWQAIWRAHKSSLKTVEFEAIALLQRLIAPAAPVDSFELGETAVALVRLGVGEDALSIVYLSVFPEARG